MKVQRVLLAMVVAAATLTACGPIQVGAAATVGDQRISSEQLDSGVREFQSALTAAKIPAEQVQLPGSVPQAVLLQLANINQFTQVAVANGVVISEGEIDNFITQQGGKASVDQALLTRGVPPSSVRDWLRASIGAQKMIAQLGGGTDEAATTAGQQKLAVEAEKVPVKFNPRYGTFDPAQGWVPSNRFGTITPAAPAAPQGEAPPAG
ncbi:SurA N-terminal domain-containing protein [Acrocarpospora sp. B8E8]|uniref:SurA N-terminal domain-containing protein n=1 Tax=Acrocarpospora sp. B8E8 TaxID=3153572 RepID=UPI00325F6062